MRSSITRIGLLPLLLILLSTLSAGAPALAVPDQNPQTAEDILEECLEMIDELTLEIEESIDQQTTAVVAQINLMRADGAPDKKLNKTAKSGKKNLSNTARSGLAQLNRITGSCMIRMRRIGSDRILNNALLAARSEAFRTFKDAAEVGGEQIDAALAGEPGPLLDEGVPEDFRGSPL